MKEAWFASIKNNTDFYKNWYKLDKSRADFFQVYYNVVSTEIA